MLDVMSGQHWGDRHSILAPEASFVESMKGGVKGLRVAWSPNLGYAVVSREVLTICEQAAKKLAEMGATVEEANPSLENAKDFYQPIFLGEYRAKLSLLGPLDKIRDRMDPQILARIALVENLTADEYLMATFGVQELAAKMSEFLKIYDLLLTPTIGIPAWQIGVGEWGAYPEQIDGKPVNLDDWLLTYPFNLTGQPAASIPVGWTEDGLPVGLQIVGRRADEASVFRAAAAFEQACPWANKKPQIS